MIENGEVFKEESEKFKKISFPNDMSVLTMNGKKLNPKKKYEKLNSISDSNIYFKFE